MKDGGRETSLYWLSVSRKEQRIANADLLIGNSDQLRLFSVAVLGDKFRLDVRACMGGRGGGAEATCGTIRLKLLKLAGLFRISARRIKFALASACPYADEWRLAAARLA